MASLVGVLMRWLSGHGEWASRLPPPPPIVLGGLLRRTAEKSGASARRLSDSKIGFLKDARD